MNKKKESDEVIGLIHVSDEDPGYIRKKFGRGFAYYDEKGEKIIDPEVLDRIRSIKIPPMWKDVWISRFPNTYLQATGYDSRRRKQYLYHEKWTIYQQQNKFNKLREFAYSLPDIREVVQKNLRKKGWPKHKVLSLILGILDETYIRIGNKQYFRTDGTVGLTTLRRKNLITEENDIILSYKAKSQKHRRLPIKNPKFRKLIKECSELRGYEVFRYMNEEGKTVPVDSDDVNEYLREITGEDFTSKNFRTWGGTVLAVRSYHDALEKTRQNKKLKLRRAIVKEVAQELNNTISVSEKYYIHPAVLDVLDDENFSSENYDLSKKPDQLAEDEQLALAIIEANPEF